MSFTEQELGSISTETLRPYFFYLCFYFRLPHTAVPPLKNALVWEKPRLLDAIVRMLTHNDDYSAFVLPVAN